MNTQDRKDLARIGERTLNIWRVVEKLEKHQETQNGLILETVRTTASNKTRGKIQNYILVAMWGAIIATINRVW